MHNNHNQMKIKLVWDKIKREGSSKRRGTLPILLIACYHLIYGTIVLSEICILLKIKLEYIYFIKLSTVVSQGGKMKLFTSL